MTGRNSHLKTLYTRVLPGIPVMLADLANLGISAEMAVYYARTGWLKRLAHGVYCHPTEPPALYPSLLLLQRSMKGLHVGGKTALDWYGDTQYLYAKPTTRLYGWDGGRPPKWFTEHFRSTYRRKRLFNEQPDAPLHVAPYTYGDESSPLVSSPERALLEMLSEVKPGQTMDEARELTELSYTMRAEVLRELLERCLSLKTARLCRALGEELGLPWAEKITPEDRNTLAAQSRRPAGSPGNSATAAGKSLPAPAPAAG